MVEKELETALLLLYSARKAITNRRNMEAMCNYPAEYGGDQLLLEKIKEYLNRSNIKIRINELIDRIELEQN